MLRAFLFLEYMSRVLRAFGRIFTFPVWLCIKSKRCASTFVPFLPSWLVQENDGGEGSDDDLGSMDEDEDGEDEDGDLDEDDDETGGSEEISSFDSAEYDEAFSGRGGEGSMSP